MVLWTGIAVLVLQLAGAPAARAPDPQALFQADVEKLLEVTGAATMGAQMAGLVSNQVIDSMRQNQPSVPARAVEIVKDVLNVEFARAFEQGGSLRQKMVQIQMKYFTHDEVKALLEFYSTPVGRKAISVMPLAAQEGAVAGQEWAAANMARIGANLQDRLRTEGFIK
jgi:hypothetical protein